MKLRLTVCALMMSAVALSVSAQSGDSRATRVAYEKSTSHNWFISLQGGGYVMMNGTNADAKFGDRLFFAPSLAVGKWHNPYYATRLKVSAGEAITYASLMGNLDKQTNKFVGGHYDFMFDVVNFFSGYDRKNFLHVIPFAGLGYEYKWDNSAKAAGNGNVHTATANAGLQLALRLGTRVDFLLEGEAIWNGLRLSRSYALPHENNLRLGASAGLNFRLGKVGFTAVKPQDEAQIASLQSQINALRAENAELSKRPTHCPDAMATTLPVMPSTNNRFLAEKSVLFGLNKSKVSDDQLINLFDAAEFVKKNDGELVVVGFLHQAERRRSPRLAEERAKEVARLLNEKYGVASEKITVEWKDASEAPFAGKDAAWNRSVIIRSK